MYPPESFANNLLIYRGLLVEIQNKHLIDTMSRTSLILRFLTFGDPNYGNSGGETEKKETVHLHCQDKLLVVRKTNGGNNVTLKKLPL